MVRFNQFFTPRLRQRLLLIGGLAFVLCFDLVAQRAGNGSALTAITNVETTLATWVGPVTNICYILAAIIGIIGGFSVYSKYNSGDPQAGSAAAKWVAAGAFLVLIPTILTTLFGVTVA